MKSSGKVALITLTTLYRELLRHFGPRNWWPADSPFEVIIGAILTQNTSWRNVEKALENLKKHNALDPVVMERMKTEKIAGFIRSSGFYNQKARTIKGFLLYYKTKYNVKIEFTVEETLGTLRKDLLQIKGIGEETADCILLYAFKKTTFVVDSYTKRIITRIGINSDVKSYKSLKRIIESSIPEDMAIYNEFHSLFVQLGREYCRSKPLCNFCPVLRNCKFAIQNSYNLINS